MFFSPFSIAITSLGEVRANLSAFRTFVRFVLVWICRFPLPLGVWEGLRFVIMALLGLFSYLFFFFFFFLNTNEYRRDHHITPYAKWRRQYSNPCARWNFGGTVLLRKYLLISERCEKIFK